MVDTTTYTFTDTQLADIIRFAGYPPMGNQLTGMSSWHFFQEYGLLKFRSANYTNTEGAIIVNWLGNLNTLEQNWINVGITGDMDMKKVGPYERDLDEERKRYKLLIRAQRRFCAILGIPPGDGIDDIGTATIVA
jgi:hypothetical protein